MKDPHPNLIAIFDEADIRVWHCMVVGLDKPFLGGEYIFRLTAPDDFPMKPPRFEFITKNGVYEPGGAICISVGEFHADDKPGKDGASGWRPALGMAGFATQVVNGMICHDTLKYGIRIKNTTDDVKMAFAKKSAAMNRKMHPLLAAQFESVVQTVPDSSVATNMRNGQLKLAGKPIPEQKSDDPPEASTREDNIATEENALSDLIDKLPEPAPVKLPVEQSMPAPAKLPEPVDDPNMDSFIDSLYDP